MEFKKKNQLFRIINAMKATEKAYFKKFGYKQEKLESAVFDLFDLIDKQLRAEAADDLNEENLIEAFEKKHPQLNYTKVKSRLLEQILDVLRDYDKKQNEIERVFDYIAYAESLRKRDLFLDAWQVLHKAGKLAEELEMIELLIFIKSKKYYYEIYTEKYKVQEDNNATIAAIMENVDTLRNRIESDFAAYRVLHFQKTIGLPRSEKDMELLKEIKAQPAFEQEDFSQLNTSRLNMAVAKSGIFFSLGDTQSVINVTEKLIQSYHPSEKLKKATTTKYLCLFDSFLQAALLSLNIKLFEQYYPLFKEIQASGEDDQNLQIGIDLYLRSIYAIVSGQLDSIPELVKAFDQVKEKSFIPNYRKISLAYYMCFGPMLAEDYKLAYTQIQWIKNNKHLGLRADIEVGILGMECIILLQQSELDVLTYRLRAFDEFLKKQQRKFEMEAAMIQLFQNGISAENPKSRIEVYAKSLAQMKEIIALKPEESAFLHAFDIISWLESKTSNLSFKEAYFKNNIPS